MEESTFPEGALGVCEHIPTTAIAAALLCLGALARRRSTRIRTWPSPISSMEPPNPPNPPTCARKGSIERQGV